MVQGTPTVHDHTMSFGSMGKWVTIDWSNEMEYHVSFGQSRFEFSAGKLSEALFGPNDKYMFGDMSTHCNIPSGVGYEWGNSQFSGSVYSPYTCENCETMTERVCSDGIKQLCDYSPGVLDNPSVFYEWSQYGFTTICEVLYSACEFGRVDVECDMNCSDTEVPVLEPATCVTHPEGYLGCFGTFGVSLTGPDVSLEVMNSESCSDICSGGEFSFHMTFKGDRCRCADFFNFDVAELREEGSCNTVCIGTPGEFCGGNNLGVSLYQTPAP